jgi:quercetin dioxygenase-like cupin family protein
VRSRSMYQAVAFGALFALGLPHSVSAQLDPRRGPPGCVPASERTMEVGCYILVSDKLGELPAVPLYWHLDRYPSRAAAEAAKGPRGTVVEALGEIWLMTIAEAGWRASGGEHVAEIGPLTVSAGTSYTAAYMEAIMFPGAETAVHRHPGPEVLYPLSGEECMETPEGKFVGVPERKPVIVPADTPHKLTITGTEKRRSLALVLHDTAQLWAIRTHDHGWTPKGLCKAR